MVTQDEIAKRLNISRTTVARALNGRLVSEETKQRVLEEAKKLGVARSGVTVACHTMTETDMEQDTPETLEATLQQFEAEMRRWGIRGVRSYAYVNGRYKADCLNTV